MDISKWPLNKIMQLPDWCFGRRWWVGTYIGTAADAASYFLIEESVPDRFVLWDVLIFTTGHTDAIIAYVTFRLCREVPTSGNIKNFDRLLKNFSTRAEMYDLQLPPVSAFHVGPMRTVINAGNNRIGGALKLVSETANCENTVACLISSIPRDIPDLAGYENEH